MSSIENGTDLPELNTMLLSFRVSDLSLVLASAGKSKSGRKQDLLERVQQLLKEECSSSSSQIEEKVKELYLKRFPRSKPVEPARFTLTENRIAPFQRKEEEKSYVSGYLVHPDVRFKEIAFYDVLSNVLKPSSLITMPQRVRSRTDFAFTLSEEQVKMIRNSRDHNDPLKRDQVQVQLRFCLLETTCEQEDFLPPILIVRINHQVPALPPYIPSSNLCVLPRRANRPIDITMFCRISVVTCNNLEVSWVAEHQKNFVACVNIVSPLSSETLLQRLKRKGVRSADHSKALIKEKLARDPDSDIATTSLKVSLLCPLGTMRMNVPIRPITCTHMQCFDAMLFLQMNEKKPTWVCPVCDKPAAFLDLFIDGLFMEILDGTKETEILFLEGGKWEPVHPKLECHSLCTPCKSSTTSTIVKNSSRAVEKHVVLIDEPKSCGAAETSVFLNCHLATEKPDIEMIVAVVSNPNIAAETTKDKCSRHPNKFSDFFKKKPKKKKGPSLKRVLDHSNSPKSSPTVEALKRKEPIFIDLTCDSDEEDARTPSRPQRKDADGELDEIQCVSSTSLYCSDTASVHRDHRRRSPQDLTWCSTRDVPCSTPKISPDIFNHTNSSARSSSYGHTSDISASPARLHTPDFSIPGSRDSTPPLHSVGSFLDDASPGSSSYGHTDDRSASPARLHTPGFSIPGSRDSTSPLHSVGPFMNPGSLAGYQSYTFLDNAYNPLPEFPHLLNTRDRLRRFNGYQSGRTSPYLINPSSSSYVYTPTRSSTSGHISRNYMTSYPYNPYSPPLSFLQSLDSDIIPID